MPLDEVVRAANGYLRADEVDVVIYHNPCNDGCGAAVAAWLKFKDKLDYIPLEYQQEISAEICAKLTGKSVLFVDVTVPKEILTRVKSIAKKVLILDHHLTAQRELAAEEGCYFVMENSGAVIAWHYFHGTDAPAPKLLRLLEDRDLWRWKEREESEPLHYAITELHSFYFREYARYVDLNELNALITYGKSLMLANHNWCLETAKNMQKMQLQITGSAKTYSVIAGCLESGKLLSELADHLHKTNSDVDFVMLWYKTADGKFKVSLRNQMNLINVADIAKLFGGGGHARAAGATIATDPFELLIRAENRSRLTP